MKDAQECISTPAGLDEDDLIFQRMPMRFVVPIEMIRAQTSAGAAFDLACRASGLTDKEIYSHIGIDQGYFSNIKNGKATLQAEKEPLFCQRVGNTIYPEWRAYQLGCTLVLLQSEAERRAEEAERRAAECEQRAREAEDKLRLLTDVLRERLGT